ncbi:hypothetical protein NLJ89_g5866 [Agrocybe chaxingu]|uniref:DUF6533 domain-containing protein n=1 Tax=Agrocybe chaxingu TaxID=84603 RepID=A0A9W8K089_9AGAR|nr:hypothetical protein NLJ89_g5866 [Agrocybe chaxingu]
MDLDYTLDEAFGGLTTEKVRCNNLGDPSVNDGTLRHFSVASTVVLLYDMALTMGQEVETMWRSKKSFGTTLFFLLYVLSSGAYPWMIMLCNSFSCKSHTLVKLLLDLAEAVFIQYTPYTSSWSKRVVGILLRDRKHKLSVMKEAMADLCSCILHEGLIYYIVLLVLSFLSMWSLAFPLTTYSIVGLQMGLQPAICTRLLLDLREAGNTVDTGNTAGSANMGSIAFAHQTPANESQASTVLGVDQLI